MRLFLKKYMRNGILLLVILACMSATAGAAAAVTADAAASDKNLPGAAAPDTETVDTVAAGAADAGATTADAAVSEDESPDANSPSNTVAAPNASGGLNGEIHVDLVGLKDGYSAVMYDNTHGLPTSEANAIAETSEGFIWIGSYSGLVRYDGNTFERLDSSTGIASVRCLFVDRDDRLWIGTNDSGLFVMEHGEFHNWDEKNGLTASSVRAIVQDSDGTIYVATTNGISAVNPDLTIREVDNSALGEKFVHDLRLGSDGTIYGLDNAGDVFIMQKGKPAHYLKFQDGIHRFFNAILPDPSSPDHLYLASGDSQVYYCRCDGTTLVDVEMTDLDPLSIVHRFEYIDGKLWVCCQNGIGVMDENGFHALNNLPMDAFVVNVMTDYAGNLWFASSRQGVMKIVPNRFSKLFERFGLPETVINTTCWFDGRLFVGGEDGLTVLDKKTEKVLDSFPLTQAVTADGTDLEAEDLLELLKGVRIRSILPDSRGRLWICTWRDLGLVLYDRGKVTSFTTKDGLLSEQVRTICEREDGSVIVATSGGVNVIENGRVTEAFNEEDGIANTEILSVADGMNGDILAGTDGGGIYILGKDGTRHIGRNQGLTSEVILRVKRDSEKDVFWVITGTSLAYMNSEYELTTLNHFPYPNNFDLYQNSRGEVWILSSDGIYICSKEELLANAMNPFHYGISDGLPFVATANSYSGLSEEGDLYIAGTGGVAKVNIEETSEHIDDLKVAVPYIDVDGSRVYPDSSGNFTIPSSARRLTIYSHVFNYSLIDPKVSYHLKGFDKKEVTVLRSDLDPVDYTNLRGGSYEFVLRLQDFMGHESRTESVRIVKEKAIYEYGVFYLTIYTLIIAFMIWNARRYTRRKLNALEEKHKKEAESARLHSELQMAAALQDSMLPGDFPPFPGRDEFDIFASMDPAREIGGDFYDYFLIDDDHLCLTIADVSGKGIPAALFMMISKVILQNCAQLGRSVGDILQETNAAICRDNKLEMFVTVWIGILEISTGIIRAANAGHEYPALMKNGSFSLLKDRHGFVVGGMEGSKYREYEIKLEPGDKLFVYTDGLPEATDASSNMFGTDRMLEALNEDPCAAPETIVSNIYTAVGGFVKDAEQFDDLTMLCLEYKGS